MCWKVSVDVWPVALWDWVLFRSLVPGKYTTKLDSAESGGN